MQTNDLGTPVATALLARTTAGYAGELDYYGFTWLVRVHREGEGVRVNIYAKPLPAECRIGMPDIITDDAAEGARLGEAARRRAAT